MSFTEEMRYSRMIEEPVVQGDNLDRVVVERIRVADEEGASGQREHEVKSPSYTARSSRTWAAVIAGASGVVGVDMLRWC